MSGALTKPCNRCGQEKRLGEFWTDPRNTSDGRRGICKECANGARRGNRKSSTEYARQYRQANMSRHVAVRRAWEARHPEKNAAQRAVRNAVRDGRLAKPDTCQRCGAGGLIHGHHNDYSRPLVVEWYCPKCHKEVHRERA